jgi:hypothetical protein
VTVTTRKHEPGAPWEPTTSTGAYCLGDRPSDRAVSSSLFNSALPSPGLGGKPHYRCVYPEQYALANHVHHPRSV